MVMSGASYTWGLSIENKCWNAQSVSKWIHDKQILQLLWPFFNELTALKKLSVGKLNLVLRASDIMWGRLPQVGEAARVSLAFFFLLGLFGAMQLCAAEVPSITFEMNTSYCSTSHVFWHAWRCCIAALPRSVLWLNWILPGWSGTFGLRVLCFSLREAAFALHILLLVFSCSHYLPFNENRHWEFWCSLLICLCFGAWTHAGGRKKGPRELKSSFNEAQIWVITGQVPIDQCMSRHVL